MGKHGGRLLQYCKENNITLETLAKESGVSIQEIWAINRNPNKNITIDIIQKLYDYNSNITPDIYLDHEVFKKYIEVSTDRGTQFIEEFNN